jgi:hypothetical protein
MVLPTRAPAPTAVRICSPFQWKGAKKRALESSK